jgi:hypothetical protein
LKKKRRNKNLQKNHLVVGIAIAGSLIHQSSWIQHIFRPTESRDADPQVINFQISPTKDDMFLQK